MINNFLFFPFTHMTQNQLDTILSFFPSFQYYPGRADFKHHPVLQTLFEQGKIRPFFSPPGQIRKIEQKIEQYLAWAQIHKGNEINLKSLLKDTPYFTGDTSVAAIKSQIKGSGNDREESRIHGEGLQQDDLFLMMAHLCDKQNEDIDLELKDLDKIRDNLISTLRGLDNPLSKTQDKKAGDPKDQGEVMTRERIYAWTRCMAAKGALKQDGDRPLFITTSQAVFDYLEANCKDVVNALDIDTIKVHENCCENKSEWHHQFCDYLMGAIQGDGNRENDLPKVNDNCSLLGEIKLSFFSGNIINTLFNLSDKQIAVCLIKLK